MSFFKSRLYRYQVKFAAIYIVCEILVASQAGLLFAADETSGNRVSSLTVAALKSTADQWRLAADPAWRTQLFYVSRVLRTDTSIVDSPHFFLSPNGKFNLREELNATLESMFQAGDPAKPNDHVLCKFPRRTGWLIEKLGIDASALPQVPCEDYDRWRQQQKTNGISLIFASYYVNNPASMFGHTFLRLHRKKKLEANTVEPNALLDSAVNFAANPTTENSLLYPILGLTGGFPGTFSLMPYYLKVQEYNNSESRDLWEYPLNLTPSQIDHLLETLWELGPVQINYWYIDENCSYVLLMLLDTIDPSMGLAVNFNAMATPADTLRVAAAAKNLLGTPAYRPSALSKYRQREALLTSAEIIILKNLVRIDHNVQDDDFSGLTDQQKALIIDAALDFIDFDEAVAASRFPEKRMQHRVDLLGMRSQLQIAPAPLGSIPNKERSDVGHLSMRSGISLGTERKLGGEGRHYADFDWRPTLHDMASPSTGYSPDLQIKMLEFKFRDVMSSRHSASDRKDHDSMHHDSEQDEPKRHKVFVKTARWFEVLSLPPVGPVIKPMSWAVKIASTKASADDECFQHEVGGGVGASLGSKTAKFFVLGLGRLSIQCNRGGLLGVAPGLSTGFIYEPWAPVKFSIRATRARDFLGDSHGAQHIRDENSIEVKASTILRDRHEFSAYVFSASESTSHIGSWSKSSTDTGVSYGIYF